MIKTVRCLESFRDQRHSLTVRAIPPLTRLAATAQTIAVVTAFTLVAHLVTGDADALRRLGALARSLPLPPLAASAGAPPALLPGHALDLSTLLTLIVSYYLLDTLPQVVAGALARRIDPLHAWTLLYGPSLLLSLGVLGTGALVAAASRTTPALLALAGLALAGLQQGLEHGAARRATEVELQARRVDTARLHAEANRAHDVGAQARLTAVLAAVQAVARGEDLAAVTRALAVVAMRLTPFRSCVVALYDPQEGVFRPQGDRGGAPGCGSDGAVPREMVAEWMDEQRLLGYSYWAPRVPTADHSHAPRAWHADDQVLVPLLLSHGDVSGYLALSQPRAGYVPAAADLAPLEAVAALAASVVDRLRQADAARQLAATDGLTGLLNRRAIEDSLGDGLTQAARRRRPLALLMIDLDDFGGINNIHGHQVGDAALRLVAGVIRSQLGVDEWGGRYGGDEFVVVLPGRNAARAVAVAERVRRALVAATTQAVAEGTLPLIHTSIGVAACPDHGSDPASLIKAADDALYASKRRGKNCVSLAPAA